jgi:hypothetical protein
VDRATAIRLLTIQLETGQRLLKARPLGEEAHSRWGLNTKNHLEKAFGRGSPSIVAVIEAGGRTVLPIDADKKWWEAYRAERLTSQLGQLVAVLRLLGAEPNVTIPRLEKPRMPSSEPKVTPSRREPKTAPAEPRVAPSGREPDPVAPEAAPKVAASAPESELLIALAEPGFAEPAPENDLLIPIEEPEVAPRTESQPTTASTEPEYFTGVACLNGHIITGAAEAYPGRATPRCRECGAAAVSACRDCGAGLCGGQYSGRLDNRAEPSWVVPNYCPSCGAAFPWTMLKREALEATIGELQELETAERDGLLALVPDTISETPKTAVAVMRWKRALAKLTAETRSLVTDVLNQSAVSLVVQHLGLAP